MHFRAFAIFRRLCVVDYYVFPRKIKNIGLDEFALDFILRSRCPQRIEVVTTELRLLETISVAATSF